jgi:DNA-binding response OmpR family regulator/tetratricopeptide (TPR) repeat protein
MGKTILVIEDDKSVVSLLEDVLKDEGFDVLVERDGEWGLRKFQEKPIDLIIVDVLIPKIKGFDLITRLRETEKGKNLPIIVISGVYRAANHKQRIVEKHKVVEYLDKPIDVDHLIDVLHDVFSSAYPVPGEPPLPPPPSSQVVPQVVPLARKESVLQASKLEVGERGDLASVPFARLLGGMFAVRATGTLLLKKGTIKKIVYLRQGIPVFVKSNLVTECLGRVMVQERMITEDQCAKSLERKKTSTKKQGEILVEMGAISSHNLEFGLELQMQTKLYEMFSWLEGEYQFIAKDDFAGQAVALSMGPTAMIHEGASRTMSADRIERDLERIADLPVKPAKDPTLRYQALELDPRAERLLDRIDGKRTLKKLLEEADFDIEDAALLIYALTSTGLLQVTGEPFEEIAEPMELDENDVVALSTNEINPAVELAKIFDRPVSEIEGAKSLDAAEFAPPPSAEPISESIALEPDPAPIEELPPPPLGPLDPPLPEPVPLATATVPQMSDEIRRQIRARLDGEAMKMISQRPQPAPIPSSAPKKIPSSPKTPPKKEAPKLDLDRDHARTKRELSETLDRLMTKDLYEVLGVSRRASLADLKTAHQKVIKEHHPDRVLAGSTSRELRAIAERILIRIDRALDTLAHEPTRRVYDREIGIEDPEARIAPLVSAERAFVRGREALDANDFDRARECFLEATEKCPAEGTYHAFLGFSTYLASPKDEETRSAALDALDRAVELSPFVEEVYLFRGTIHQKSGNRIEAIRELERALRCNPDSVVALDALRALDPPKQQKTGFLSRLTS